LSFDAAPDVVLAGRRAAAGPSGVLMNAEHGGVRAICRAVIAPPTRRGRDRLAATTAAIAIDAL
jgi:hypothetical protein